MTGKHKFIPSRLHSIRLCICVVLALMIASPVNADTEKPLEAREETETLDDESGEFQPLRHTRRMLQSILAEEHLVTVANIPVRGGISGRVSRAFLYGDNGRDDELFFIDNNFSSSEIRAAVEATITDDLVVGGRLKVPVIFNSSVDVDFDRSSDFSLSFGDLGDRELDGYVATTRFGRLAFGLGSTASNQSSEVDNSGTRAISSSRIRDLAGGLSFNNGGPQIKDAFRNYDGLGDETRIRYDMPEIGGYVVSASVTEEGAFDVAVRYESVLGDYKLKAALAYARRDDDIDQISSSVSALANSGLSVTLALAGQDRDDRDPIMLYAKVAHIFNWLSIGPSALGIDLAFNRDAIRSGDDAVSVGIFGVQSIKIGKAIETVDVYLGARA